jgi:hypothetical protein
VLASVAQNPSGCLILIQARRDCFVDLDSVSREAKDATPMPSTRGRSALSKLAASRGATSRNWRIKSPSLVRLR